MIHEENSGRAIVFRFLSTKTASISNDQRLAASKEENFSSKCLRNWHHVTTRRERTANSLAISRLLTSTGRRRELLNYLSDRRGLLASILDHFHLQALQDYIHRVLVEPCTASMIDTLSPASPTFNLPTKPENERTKAILEKCLTAATRRFDANFPFIL